MKFSTTFFTLSALLLPLFGLGAQNQFTSLLEVDSCANWIRAVFADPIDDTQTNFVLLYQHRGAMIETGDNANFGTLIDLNGVGRVEVNRIGASSGDTLFLLDKIQHDYLVENEATMVVLQTDLNGTPITEEITAPPYDGVTGGIIFLPSTNELVVNANLDASGAGYAGGESSIRESQCGAFTNANNYFYAEDNWRGAYKGQSLTFPSVLNGREMGRGPNLTGGGGGNDHNAGGGGGGHVNPGGDGAQNEEPGFFNCSGNFPGLGGQGLRSQPEFLNRLFFGGGGGSGHGNNPNPTTGGNGGGMVIFYAEIVTFADNAMISAAGINAAEVDGDGGGGGGAGGSIIVYSDSISGNARFNAAGGSGGSVDNSGQNRCFGPGGGGAGGRIYFPLLPTNSTDSFTFTLGGGSGGISQNSAACPGNTNRGENGGNGSFEFEFIDDPADLQEHYAIPALIEPTSTLCQGEIMNLVIPNATNCLTGAYFERTGPEESDLILIGEVNTDGAAPLTFTVPAQDSLFIVFRQYLTGELMVIETTINYDITPQPTAAFNSDLVDNTLTVTSITLNDVTDISWDFGDGNTSNDLQPIHIYESPGTYQACLNYSGPCGSSQTCREVVIAPSASFVEITTDNLNYCVGDTVFMVNNSINVSNLSWSLSPDNGDFFPSSFNESPFLLLTDTGNYEITLMATSNQGEVLNTTTVFNLRDVPDYNLSNIIADDFTVAFTAEGGGADQFAWTILGEEFTDQEIISYTFSGPGTYQAVFTASNECGTFTDTVTVELFNAVEAVVSTPISTGCAPLTTSVINESNGDFTTVEWALTRMVSEDSLDFTGATVLQSSNEEILLRFDTAGFYEVQLLISGPGGIDSVVQSFSISAPPVADFTVAESGGFIELTNLSENADTYLWNFGDGNTSTEFQPTHQYLTTGNFNVNLNATNAACGRARSETVAVDDIVSVNDPIDNKIIVSPNPGNGLFLLASPVATYEVFDQAGRLVVANTAKQADESTIDLLNQPAGVYLLIIKVNNQLYTRRLVKE